MFLKLQCFFLQSEVPTSGNFSSLNKPATDDHQIHEPASAACGQDYTATWEGDKASSGSCEMLQ